MIEALIVYGALETKSLLIRKRKLSKQRLAKDQSFLGRAIDKIYITPFLHRTIAITPLPPALFTSTQEKTGVELQNIENTKYRNCN